MVTSKLETLRKPLENTASYLKKGNRELAYSQFPSCWRAPDNTLVWSPLMEMYSNEVNLVVRLELPAVDRENIHITVVGNNLVIKGERKPEPIYENSDFYRCELAYGKFSRTIPLPVEIMKDEITANHNNGLLEIHLPKAAGAASMPLEITVQSSSY
jgi:HSP20 family protein